jgi:EPS-associated MarR family transcriptional regulator
MNKRNPSDNSQEHFDLLRSVHNNPNASQRDLAQNLNISLGKLNYLIKSFSNRGFIKINNFSKSRNKINYIYVLTPKGLKRKIEMTFKFMDAKLKEYDELKKEVNNVDSGKNKK